MKLLGIAGSLRAGRTTAELLSLLGQPPRRRGLRRLGRAARPAGVRRGRGERVLVAVAAFRSRGCRGGRRADRDARVQRLDPGALKNALDWASRPRDTAAFRGKPVAAIGASTGSFGGVWAHAETRKILGLMGARVVEAELSVGKANERLDEPDEELVGQLRAVVDLLVSEASVRAVAA